MKVFVILNQLVLIHIFIELPIGLNIDKNGVITGKPTELTKPDIYKIYYKTHNGTYITNLIIGVGEKPEIPKFERNTIFIGKDIELELKPLNYNENYQYTTDSCIIIILK